MSSQAQDSFINYPTFTTQYEEKKFFPLPVDVFPLFQIDVLLFFAQEWLIKKTLNKKKGAGRVEDSKFI